VQKLFPWGWLGRTVPPTQIFPSICYLLAGILIKLKRAVEGTVIGQDDASTKMKRSTEPKKLL